MADIANRDEARRCIRIAEAAVRERDLAKAEKFLKKAKQLYSSEEIYKAALSIESIITDFSGGSSRPANGHTPHHEQPEPSRNHRSSGDTPSSSNAAGPKLPNRNTDHLRNRKQPEPEPDLGTPEQKALVQHILKAKDLYAVLDVQKTASDDDIKKAYRKLALKLHPDKNKARGAEEAFKSVSKAFTVLSDPDKRAYYDRTGHESAQAHAAAAQQQRGAGGARYYQQEEIDPEEIFNMFFGGMFPGNARVFRTHYAGGHPHRRTHQQHAQQQQQQQQADTSRQAIFGLLQFLPVLLLVLVTLFSGTQQPTYSLVRDRTFSSPLKTQRLEVEYYVKSESDFEKSYPRGSSARYRLERQVESTYYEELEGRCQHEKMMKQRAWAWGNRDQALAMKLESCEKMERMYEKINHRRSSYPR